MALTNDNEVDWHDEPVVSNTHYNFAAQDAVQALKRKTRSPLLDTNNPARHRLLNEIKKHLKKNNGTVTLYVYPLGNVFEVTVSAMKVLNDNVSPIVLVFIDRNLLEIRS